MRRPKNKTVVGQASGEADAKVLLNFLVGRYDPYVFQKDDGSYGVIRHPFGWEAMRDHLEGVATFGTYTIREDGTCRTVTWDIDSSDLSDVMYLVAFVQGPYAVFTSGRKGWHVIQSFDPPIPSNDAYEYGLMVKTAAGLPNVESFPKQPKVTGKGYGNLTKLPLGIHKVTGERSKLIQGRLEFAPAPDLRGPRAAVVDVRGNPTRSPQDSTWLCEMFDGVSEGQGRNNTLYKFVGWLRARDFPQELIELNANFVNETYFDPPMDSVELGTVVRPS